MKKYFCMIICSSAFFMQAMDSQPLPPQSSDKLSSLQRSGRQPLGSTPLTTRRKVIKEEQQISPRSMNTKFDVHPNPIDQRVRQNSLDQLMKKKSDS